MRGLLIGVLLLSACQTDRYQAKEEYQYAVERECKGKGGLYVEARPFDGLVGHCYAIDSLIPLTTPLPKLPRD